MIALTTATDTEAVTNRASTSAAAARPRGAWPARVLLAAALLALPLLAMPAAASAAAAPAWDLSLTSRLTRFVPGSSAAPNMGGSPQYKLLVTNIGGEATSGPIVITETLPTGIAPVGAFSSAFAGASVAPACAVDAQTVTCTSPGPLQPGQWIAVMVPVKVDPLLDGSTVTNQVTVSGGGTVPAQVSTETAIGSSPASFGFAPGQNGFRASLIAPDGAPATQAGSHPYQFTLSLAFNTVKPGALVSPADGGLRDLEVNLPRGLVVNPGATPVLCTELQMVIGTPTEPGCPDASQIGLVTIPLLGGPITSPLYNMVPPPGVPAEFAFNATGIGVIVHILGDVRSDSDYGLSSLTNEILAKVTVEFAQVELWGDPSGSSHDAMRGACVNGNKGQLCPVPAQDSPLLTMPSACSESLSVEVRADSWKAPGNFHSRNAEIIGANGNPVSVSGCNQLEFEPTIEAQPTTNLADSPTGLNFNLHQPQNLDYEGLSTANLKDTTVTLPRGLAVNPSSADGLGACSISEVGLTTDVGEGPIRFDKEPAGCPNASKLGSVEVTTPLLKSPLPGAVYLAEPYENPFGSLLAIYLTIHDEEQGVVAKLAGEVTPDPNTGQLTARFEENPELPLEDVKVNFFGGPRASLRTPPLCATYTTTADLTPWSAPEGEDAHPTDSFAIQASPSGGSCPTSEGNAPHAPSFSAGTLDPVAGAYSPFVLRVSRQDATQELSAIDATLPPGLSARIAGIPYCPESAIAQAKAREAPNQGALELFSPSCPSSSQVGTVDVAAGAGITPLHVQGKAYLAGPHKGAPLSLVVITPAVAGPFDLGAVVVRTALQVDPRTAQVKAVSDPLPTILEGIPLDVRSVTVKAEKPDFSLNPTSCDPMAVTGSATSVLNQSAALSNPFQVGGCKGLAFKPKLQIRLKGKTRRGAHPALTAIATFTEGHANTKKAAVTLPRSAFLDQAHIRTVCTRVQFAADQCPQAAIYGFARAFTPLLDQPLEGPVYLRSSDNELPDLVTDLRGQVRVELVGRVDSINGGIRNTFEAAPDAPVSRFVLKMQGGTKGLLQNSENLCRASKAKRRATVSMDAHNGKTHDFRPVVRNDCGKKGRRGKRR